MMNKIDTSAWQEFRIGDLFDIHPTTSYRETNAALFEDDGTNPVVVNSSYNNGIGGYTKKKNTEQGNIITFSDTTTADAIFYQPNDFVGYPHVQGMYPLKYQDKWNEYSLRFFMTIFKSKAKSQNVDYSNKLTRSAVKEFVVKLPVDNDKAPNWEFMESCIKESDKKAQSILRQFKRIKATPTEKIDVTNWQKFYLYDLFEIKSGNGFDRVRMRTDSPCVNFIARSGMNNGIKEKVNRIENITPHPAGCLTVALGGAYLGSCFVQDEPFYTSQNVDVLVPKINMPKEAKLFIATMIFVESQLHYKAFIKELNKYIKKEFCILLPINAQKQIDFEYMTQFIKNRFCRIQGYAHFFS